MWVGSGVTSKTEGRKNATHANSWHLWSCSAHSPGIWIHPPREALRPWFCSHQSDFSNGTQASYHRLTEEIGEVPHARMAGPQVGVLANRPSCEPQCLWLRLACSENEGSANREHCLKYSLLGSWWKPLACASHRNSWGGPHVFVYDVGAAQTQKESATAHHDSKDIISDPRGQSGSRSCPDDA